MSAPDETTYLKTAFLLRVAHELRGPAGVIQGSITELAAALGEDAERYRGFLAMAQRGVARVMRTACLLEQTGQLAAGAVEFEARRCDLRDVVRAAVERAESIEGRRRITTRVVAPDGPVMHDLDAEWMTAALAELASNALRHAAHRVEVRVEPAAGETRVTFEDDGEPAAIFGPVRFQPPPERRGHGLALAIARDVIEAHGGALAIEPGKGAGAGTRVRAVLPLAAKKDVAEGDRLEGRSRGARPS